MRRLLLIFVLALFVAGPVYSEPRRTSKTVRQEKQENQRKINKTKSDIQSNVDKVRRQIARYESLGAEISEADSKIKNLQRQHDSVASRVKILVDSIAITETRISLLKDSYGSSLRNLRRQRQISSSTAFVFSAKSFTEARKRMRYLEELGKWQTEKAAELRVEADRLDRQKQELDVVKKRVGKVLADLKIQKRRLQSSQDESDALVKKLRGQGRQLEQALKEQQAQARRLDEELNKIIEEEARAAAEAERKRREAEEKAKKEAAKTGQSSSEPSNKPEKKPEAKKPSNSVEMPADAANFAAAKGKLPMPVSGSAMIVSDFGRHTHKDFSKVQVQNNGIDIETSPGSSALAVYPGVVSMVIVMDGYHNVVLVRHGEYLTVYAGISELAVHKGQQVKTGQALGKIYSDPLDDNRTRLHFEVRHEIEKLNPNDWLR